MKTPSWGRSPWRIDSATAATAPPERCEVAVIGAGLTGLATAWELARRGTDVVVLEAWCIGHGSSGRTGGIVLEGTAAGELPDAGDCIAALRAVVEAAGIDCRLRVPGCHEIAHVDEPSGPLRWRDAGRTICISRKVAGGTVDPGALLAGLARAAMEAGASIHDQSPVAALELGDPAALLVSGRRLVADRIVVALNAFLPAFLS
jgi:gamma-glutamylputrescine oxidase